MFMYLNIGKMIAMSEWFVAHTVCNYDDIHCSYDELEILCKSNEFNVSML